MIYISEYLGIAMSSKVLTMNITCRDDLLFSIKSVNNALELIVRIHKSEKAALDCLSPKEQASPIGVRGKEVVAALDEAAAHLNKVTPLIEEAIR